MAAYPQVELFAIDPAYQSASSAKSQSASMLQSSTAGLVTEPPQNHFQREKPRSISSLFAVVFQLLAFVWVGGIAYLLYVNYKQRIIGASAWCTFNTCFPQVWVDDPSVSRALLAKFDRDTHNLLGGLQLAAKLAEIWFCLIAAWLVYLKTMKLAQSPEGLPIGYILRHIEFADTLSLFDKLTWTTSSAHRRHGSRHRLLFYICLTGILCVLCNLMGPAVAVLLLPSLQWIHTETNVTERLDVIYASEPPRSNGFAMKNALQFWNVNWPSCNGTTDMPSGSYICSGVWANSLDAWVEAVFARQGFGASIASSQDGISFNYNKTNILIVQPSQQPSASDFSETVIWVPSRQVLADLNDDLGIIQEMSRGNITLEDSNEESYFPYNNTVSTILHRIAPALGATVDFWMDYNDTDVVGPYFYDIEIKDNQLIRCYKEYSLSDAPKCWMCKNSPSVFTRCITLNQNDRDASAGFLIGERYMKMRMNDTLGPFARIQHIVSDQVALVPEHKVPQSVIEAGFDQRCLEQDTSDRSGCNWDALFEMTKKDTRFAHRSTHANTLHIMWDSRFGGNTKGLKDVTITVAIDFVAFQGVADYALDASRISNPFTQLNFQPQIIRNEHGAFEFDLVKIHPFWTIATWTANANQSFTLDVSRAAPGRMQKFLELLYKQFYSNKADIRANADDWLESIALVPIMQMLSIIDFETTQANTKDRIEPRRPLIKRHGSIRVWAYGITSRTGWLGLVVAGCGCIVVLYEVYIGLKDRRQFRSPTQILISALQHNLNGEFDGLRKEKDVARISFRLEDDYSSAGQLRFERAR